jgi:hypothetical protein
MAKLMAT